MSAHTTYDFRSSEEEAAFDRLMKRVLAEEWERFPAPSGRVWRALAARLGSQANGGLGAPGVTVIAGGTGWLSNPPRMINNAGEVLGLSGPGNTYTGELHTAP